MQNRNKGILYGVSAYLLWGFLPIYWKLLDNSGADVVLAHRIIWSFAFMTFFILFTGRTVEFISELKRIIKNRKTMVIITSASLIISLRSEEHTSELQSR